MSRPSPLPGARPAGRGEAAPRSRRGGGSGKRITGVLLGVLSGIGGFIDMGGIVTSSQAGATYRYALLWTVVPGIVGFAVYAEMAGRVVISSGRTTFDVVRDRLGKRLSLVPLAALTLVNLLTLVVEICGMALALELASRISYLLWVPLAAVLLVVVIWRLNVEVMDNAAAVLGLTILVTVVAMVVLHPAWPEVGAALLHPDPRIARPDAAYLFSAIALLGAYMTPYQFEFYSSSAIEQQWSGKDLLTNRMSAIVGTCFGGIITVALMVVAATVLYPQHIHVDSLAQAAQPTLVALGVAGLALFLIGTFAVSMGAGLETGLSGAYSICQYFGWDWGKRQRPADVPLFHLVYLVMFALAVVIALTHVDPIRLTIVTMALAAVALPFTLGPLLIVANDRDYVGEQHNTAATNVVALLVLGLLIVVTITAVPLLLLSGGGS
jgi:manganese transport protein